MLGNIKIGLWSNEEKVMWSDKACPEVMGVEVRSKADEVIHSSCPVPTTEACGKML